MGYIGNYILNLASLTLGGFASAGFRSVRQPTRPLLFSYYVTHRCNLNCTYCCDGDGKRFKEDPIPELTTGDAVKLISILSRSADTLDVTGGEPMLRADLEEILSHAQHVGMRTVLNTKAIGLKERPDLLRFSDVLVISIDSLDEARLGELLGAQLLGPDGNPRPPEVARAVLDALDFAIQRRGATRTKVVVSAVATPTNLGDVAGVLDFAVTHGLGFHVSPEIVGTRANPALRNNLEYQELIGKVLAAKARGKAVLGIPEYLQGIRDFRPFRCYPMLMPVIRPDGLLYYPCLESKNAEISVLEAGGYRKALRLARARRGEIPACRDCCHIFCHMGLSLLQRHPCSALKEARYWGSC